MDDRCLVYVYLIITLTMVPVARVFNIGTSRSTFGAVCFSDDGLADRDACSMLALFEMW